VLSAPDQVTLAVGASGDQPTLISTKTMIRVDNLRRVFTRMTDIPIEEINAALASPWLSLFLGQFTDYTQDQSLPQRTKEKMI
jgi:hypothetical protein